MATLDLDFVRSNFPALVTGFAYFDNAGGSQALRQAGERLCEFLYTSNVQVGASYDICRVAVGRIASASQAIAQYIHAESPSEVVVGPSSTQLLANLAVAMQHQLAPGDEIVVTDSDHEANIGPWRRLTERGVVIKEWPLHTETYELDFAALDRLMTPRTRLVCFPHVSNILGTINPVAAISRFVHGRGARVCVDGVSYAPHREIDVRALGVDYYVWSAYKVFAPHFAVLYGKRELLLELANINHFFLRKEAIPLKLQPGNINFETTYSFLGIVDYLRAVTAHHAAQGHSATDPFDMFAEHEEQLAQMLLSFLATKKNVRVIGSLRASRDGRVPTVSFVIEGRNSGEIPPLLDPHRMGIKHGDFYAKRLMDALALNKHGGVVRVSLVHYNTVEEVSRLISVLDAHL